jgi:hypothetical protein
MVKQNYFQNNPEPIKQRRFRTIEAAKSFIERTCSMYPAFVILKTQDTTAVLDQLSDGQSGALLYAKDTFYIGYYKRGDIKIAEAHFLEIMTLGKSLSALSPVAVYINRTWIEIDGMNYYMACDEITKLVGEICTVVEKAKYRFYCQNNRAGTDG